MSIRNDLEDAFNEGYAKGLKEGRRFAEPVVRCKDCIHYWKNKPSDDVTVCLASPREDAYCSEGERREDEAD